MWYLFPPHWKPVFPFLIVCWLVNQYHLGNTPLNTGFVLCSLLWHDWYNLRCERSTFPKRCFQLLPQVYLVQYPSGIFQQLPLFYCHLLTVSWLNDYLRQLNMMLHHFHTLPKKTYQQENPYLAYWNRYG